MIIWVLIAVIIWLTCLTAVVLLQRNHYKRLVKVGGRRDLEGILEKILDRLEEDRLALEKINKAFEKVSLDAEFHIQKVGLVRFNPFSDTGGDQSFVLALLDKNNNGVVISSLHARTSTRWYAKSILTGKGKNIELSKEEEKAIKEAGDYNIKYKNLI